MKSDATGSRLLPRVFPGQAGFVDHSPILAKGELDGLRIYNRALGPEEIAIVNQAGL